MSPRSCGRVCALVCTLAALAAEDPATALDRAVASLPSTPRDLPQPTLRLIDLSLNILAVAGASTADDEQLSGLKAGGHDPARSGFTLQAAELSLAGAVDPYFTAAAHLVATEEGVELEEAFLTTTGLPARLEAKVGYQLIEFGRVNPSHPHAWAWLDQPVVASRLLGPEGSRSAGARVAWLAPMPWFSQVMVGGYDADDGSLASFRGNGGGHHHHGGDASEHSVGGRPWQEDHAGQRSLAELVWLARWQNVWALGAAETGLGLSYLTGPNAAGGRSHLYGVDAHATWTPAAGGPVRRVALTAEAMVRRSGVAAAVLNEGTLDEVAVDADSLVDRGAYAQALVGLGERWAVGLRTEWALGSGDSVLEDEETEVQAPAGADADPLRDRRLRVSPLVQYQPSEFSRVRLQYDYDRNQHLDREHVHSVWLGVEVLIGAHPAHGW